MKASILKILSIPAAIVLVLFSIISANANSVSVIDFEGLASGTIVSSLSSGSGISGAVVSGSVKVFGLNPNFPGVNAAMIFDATCSPGGTPQDCTGGDADLFAPELGNILILSEDLDQSDPNDADVKGAFYEFDYSGWGSGTVTVESMLVFDVEAKEGNAKAELYSGGTLISVVSLPITGDNQYAITSIGVSGVDFMRVTLHGSGAIDNVRIQPDTDQTVTDTPAPTPTDTPTSLPTPTATGETPPQPTPPATETTPPPPTEPPPPTPTPTGETPPPAPPPATPSEPDPTATPAVLLPVTGESPLDPPGRNFGPFFLLLLGVALGFIFGAGFRKLLAGKLWGISLFLVLVAFGLLAWTALTPPAVASRPPPSMVQEVFPLQELTLSLPEGPAMAGRYLQNSIDDMQGQASQPALTAPSRILKLPYFARENIQEEVDDEGSAIKRVVIPALNLDASVRFVPFGEETWDLTGLGVDVGWLGETPYATLGNNLVLAGHATVRGAAAGPFLYLQYLRAGTEVIVYTAEDRLIYQVSDQLVVNETDISVLEDNGTSRLILVTCTDWDEDTWRYLQRVAVFADQIRVEPIVSKDVN